jgi:hypothetical protein
MDATKDPLAVVGEVTGLLLDWAVDEHQMDLYVLDRQIEVFDNTIANYSKEKEVQAWKASRAQVQAEMFNVAKSIKLELLHVKEQSNALDMLAAAEEAAQRAKDPNVPQIFQDLRGMNDHLRVTSRALRRACADYDAVLAWGPGRTASSLVTDLNLHMKDVQGWNGVKDRDEWLGVATQDRDYINKHEAWYGREKAYAGRMRAALLQRVDIVPIDAYVDALTRML